MKYLKFFEQHTYYNEVEFVCVNSKMNSTTTVENQHKLYNELKKDKDLLPYIQDWSEGDDIQMSLAVIILNHDMSKITKIKNIAKQFNIDVDIITKVNNKKVDEIIRGDLENLKES